MTSLPNDYIGRNPGGHVYKAGDLFLSWMDAIFYLRLRRAIHNSDLATLIGIDFTHSKEADEVTLEEGRGSFSSRDPIQYLN